MKKWVFALLIFITLLSPRNTAAQEISTIDYLEIDLWPEYDKPEMLVIYRINLSTKVSPPVELSFRIPVEAGEPNAVAVLDPNSGLLTAPYERKVDGEWALITFIATMPGIQLEYYDPQIKMEGTHREYQFTWPGDYAVEQFSIQLQQPIDASQVKTIPTQTSIDPGSDGLSYHAIEFGSLPAGEATNVSIEYFKASDALSVEGQPLQPVSPITSNLSGQTRFLDYIPWSLGLLGLFLLAGGIFWYWRLGRERREPETRKRGRRSAKAKNLPLATADNSIYCHQCGKRASNGDRFCRSCGTKLRRN